MIIFLYGKDGYRLQQNLNKIAEEYRKKYTSGMSFSVLDFADETKRQVMELTDIIKTTSFFDEKRLVILKNSFSAGPEIISLIKNWNLTEDKQRILIFSETVSETELVKKDKTLFKLLSDKPNLVKVFEPLDALGLKKWAKKEIEKYGLIIEPPAFEKLLYYIVGHPNKKEGPDPTVSYRLIQEINKLANYKVTDTESVKSKTISLKDVELLVTPTVDMNIFETLDAFASRNKLKSLLLLNKHLDSGTDPFYIFSMLVYQFRNLLRIKSLMKNAVSYPDIVKKTGLNPYVVKKGYSQCEKFDLEELGSFFSKLAQIETSTKLGNMDMAEGLYGFVLSLTP